MKTLLDDKTKVANGLCMHPGCEELGAEDHHIIFRSETKKTIIVEDPRFCVKLCSFHHRLGAVAPHRSRFWRDHYKKYLPTNWQELIDNCTTTRRRRKIKPCTH